MHLNFLAIPMFLLLFLLSESLEFSKTEWDNPGQAGSSVWIRNDKAAPVRVEALFVRDNGIRKYDEVALRVGPAKYVYKVEKAGHGKWARLRPIGGGKIRIRARDSLFVRGFEYGSRLQGKKAHKVLTQEYVLDLKLIDNTGDSCLVKVSESSSKYYIEGAAEWADLRSPGIAAD
ncbi:MAG: hypothetical protein JWP91_4701 [Fibrobacteres bacterium]|nr:hypothetical protein [Fibrobacterota bacterium]